MRLLKLGSVGPAVQLLQLALNRAGAQLKTDGVFGGATRAALLRFQTSRGILADGMAGRETHRALLPWYTGFAAHRLRPGDTLTALAAEHGGTVEAILLANPGITAGNLPIGRVLTIPLPFPVVPTDIAWSSQLVAYCVRGLAARYPFLSAGEIGRSVMGRPLWRLSVGTGDNRVLYNATHHSNEWICTPLLMKFAEELCSAYASGGTIGGQSAAALLDYASLFLVPCLDPDGMDLVTGELQEGEYFDRAMRIASAYPQFPFPSGWKANIRGVDLNLQYPALWEQARENKLALGISGPAPADFVGAAPLSAPESRAMYDYTLSLAPALTLAFHTQGQVIYWKFLDFQPPMSREIAEAFGELSGYSVEETPYLSGFAGYKDWFIQDFDRPGYTIEAGLGVNPLPLSQFDSIYRRCLGILTLGALVT